jgi:hypothetical protein
VEVGNEGVKRPPFDFQQNANQFLGDFLAFFYSDKGIVRPHTSKSKFTPSKYLKEAMVF